MVAGDIADPEAFQQGELQERSHVVGPGARQVEVQGVVGKGANEDVVAQVVDFSRTSTGSGRAHQVTVPGGTVGHFVKPWMQ